MPLIVNVCSYHVMYSFVRLKTPLDIILFTPTHIFPRDEQLFLEMLKSTESEWFFMALILVRQSTSSLSTSIKEDDCTR